MENRESYTDKTNLIEQFKAAIEANLGAHFEYKPDNELQRFDDPEKRSGNKNCWAYLNQTGTFGRYGNWGTGEKYYWHSDTAEELSPKEMDAIADRVESDFQSQVEDRQKAQAEAATEAQSLMANASNPRPDHRYLTSKSIPSANCRQYGERLLIPLQNVGGDIRSLQQIYPDGNKRFLKGGQVSGCFSLIGATELPVEGETIVCEGWATGVTLNQRRGIPVVAAMNAGNLAEVCKQLRQALADDVRISIAADDDRNTKGNPGLAMALHAADLIGADVIRPEFPCADCQCTDFNDLAACPNAVGQPEPDDDGPDISGPIPLTSSLPPVKQLVAEMMPRGFVGFVTDAATRLQVPSDYIGVACIVIAAGILGAKYRIYPKQKDPWLVTATMWAGLIGGPSTLKSACMSAAMQPLQEMEREQADLYAEVLELHELNCELAEGALKETKKSAAEIYQKDCDKALQMVKDATFTAAKPTRRRYVVNDATIEKLGELMGDNPNGLLLVRDELSGWLAKMTKEDYQGDRAFYLESFEGLNPFVYDRIGRGTIEIAQSVLSIIGGIQPSKIAPIIQNAVHGTVDDGLIQRFQLAVWPDVPNKWKWIDQPRDEAAYSSYRNALRSLHDLPVPDQTGTGVDLHFSTSAQDLYIEWMKELHGNLRSEELHPVMQSHLAKMPKTIAGLALLFELIDGGRTEVGKAATAKALLWAPYLTSHAERLYSLSTGSEVTDAKLILSRRDKLDEIFAARDIQRKNWTGLSSAQAITDALNCLIDHRYLSELPVPTSKVGGRPSVRYRWHPAAGKKS